MGMSAKRGNHVFWLRRVSTDRTNPSVIVVDGSVTVGREKADFLITSVTSPAVISRFHAELKVERARVGEPRLLLVDRSANGIQRNMSPILRNHPVEIVPNDLIAFGPYPNELEYVVELSPEASEDMERKHSSSTSCVSSKGQEYRLSDEILWIAPNGTSEIRKLEEVRRADKFVKSIEGDRLFSDTAGSVIELMQTHGGDLSQALKERSYQVKLYLEAVYHTNDDTFKHTLSKHHLVELVAGLTKGVAEVIAQKPLLVRVPEPAYVLGDLHGNFADLTFFISRITQFGDIRYTGSNVVFLGDYVDRGQHGLEVVLYLFCLKLMAPDVVHLVRGNHEDPSVNGDIELYREGSFLYQCIQHFGDERGGLVWKAVNSVFKHLPLAAVIDERVFACHGGIPRNFDSVKLSVLEGSSFPRFAKLLASTEEQQAESMRTFARDLLWSDPADDEDAVDSSGFGPSDRCDDGSVVQFGNVAIDRFLSRYNFDIVIRAHQYHADGLRVSKRGKVMTVFSTSTYCGEDNGAGVVFVARGLIRLIACATGASSRSSSRPGGRVPAHRYG